MEEKHPKHDRANFFKYTSADTALKILEASKVRYSSPLLFNDPFDYQSGLHFDFDINSLPGLVVGRIEQLVLNDELPLPSNPDWRQGIAYMREMKAAHGFLRERFAEVVQGPLAALKRDLMVFRQQVQRHWWDVFLPRLRVFSVSEVHDSLLMWSHYSRDHTGVVIELRVLPEQDNPLCVAGPVQYRASPPVFMTEAECIDQVVGVRELDFNELYWSYAYIKSDVWAYEKEWRVWDLLTKVEPTLYSDYPVFPNEIATIYLGCKIQPEKRRAIADSISKRRPEVAVFQARKSETEFALAFDAL